MSPTRTYLDYNATAPVRPEAVRRFTEVLSDGGNPSSIHFEGRHARRIVEAARQDLAENIGALPESVVFTSGGTEANNLALKGSVRRHEIENLIISATEHPSVLQTARTAGVPVHELPVDENGIIKLEQLEEAVTQYPKSLVSVMLANNETGVLQPVREASVIAHSHGCLLHTDAVQAAGKIELDFASLGADFMTLSAHKVGGPQGIGALIAAPGVAFDPEITGGGQELRRRGGTENVPGIASFAAAIVAATQSLQSFGELAHLRDRIEREICACAPAARVFGAGAVRLANTSCFAVPGMSAELALIALDLEHISVSSGSACSSGKVSHSHVLQAMQIDAELAACAIRVSFGWGSVDADADRFVEVWEKIVRQQTPVSVAAE